MRTLSALFLSFFATAVFASGKSGTDLEVPHDKGPALKTHAPAPGDDVRTFDTDELTRICNGAPLGVNDTPGRALGPVGGHANQVTVRFQNGSFYFYRTDENGNSSAMANGSRFRCGDVGIEPNESMCEFAAAGSGHLFQQAPPTEIRTLLRDDATGTWTTTIEYQTAAATPAGDGAAPEGMRAQRVTMPDGTTAIYHLPTDRQLQLVNGELQIFPIVTQTAWTQPTSNYTHYYGGAPQYCGVG